MSKDLRTYLEYLENNHPQEIVRVKREVDPSWEISAVIRRLQAEERYPAVLFEKVQGREMPVISNLFASRVRLAATFETSIDQARPEYVKREGNRLKPRLLASGPVKDVVGLRERADLSTLPIVSHSEKDAGPFVTAGVGIVRDPDTGIRNAGIYRLQYKGPKKLGVAFGTESHAGHILKKMEKRGQDLPFVVALGHHPAVCHGSQSRCPLDVDEFEVMGGLLGEPLEIARCETIDLEVPAFAEIAIEGKILAGVSEEEGPFGESTWYYGPSSLRPVMEVTAVTHRKDAIFHDLHSPYLDHNYCGVLGREANLFRRLKEMVPTVRNVVMSECGGCRLCAFVQIVKEYDGQGKNAALSALAADAHIKIAVVVDDDVDIYSEREVLWAVATRTQPDQDFFFVPGSYVFDLIPSGYTVLSRSQKGGMDTKVGIDATRPIGIPFAERCDVRRKDWEGINLKEYISG